MEGVVTGTSNVLQGGSTTNTYDVNNNLAAVTDSTKAANNRTFINDAGGRILQSTQSGNTQRQLVVNGEVLGRYGSYLNPDKPADSSGNPLFVTGSSFNFGYTKISGSYPAANPGTKVVAAGDTLASIAKSVYGDSSLWYLIADANGLGGDRDLRVGQTLTVPSRVTGARNNSNSFKPYNPGEVVGNTTPNLPSPPSGGGGGCGGLGTIIMVAVAVAVTVYTGGAGTGAVASFWSTTASLSGTALSIATGATAAALGSIASQAVGNVLGIQSGFDWNGVAMSALSGGVGAGMGTLASGTGTLAGPGLGATVARAAIGNAMTQGIAVATGMQKEFNWTSVAASAVGAGVGSALNDSIMGTQLAGPTLPGESLGSVGGLVGDMGGGTGAQIFGASLKGFAAGMATAMARGGRVEVTQVAADAFGNALGDSWGESMKRAGTQESKLDATLQENRQRRDTQAAAYDQLLQAFGQDYSGEQYAGVQVADAGGYAGDGVVSDAGGGGSDIDEPALSFTEDVAARKAENEAINDPLGLKSAWKSARIQAIIDEAIVNKGVPFTGTLDAGEKGELYMQMLRDGKGSEGAMGALLSGEKVIFGMRSETSLANDGNKGNGRYDDRVVVLKMDESAKPVVMYEGDFTADPSRRYMGQEGRDINYDDRKDLGRLPANTTHEFEFGYSGTTNQQGQLRFGSAIDGTGFNILKGKESVDLERYVNGKWISAGTAGYGPPDNFLDNQTVYFHRGWTNMTGSAGCQTFPSGQFETFFRTLNGTGTPQQGTQTQFKYYLRGM